jgi:hypothetical protein
MGYMPGYLLDLRCFRPSLLLALPHFNPLLHCQTLSQFGKFILCISKPLHKRTIRNRIQENMVIRSVRMLAWFASSWRFGLTLQKTTHQADQCAPDRPEEHVLDERMI